MFYNMVIIGNIVTLVGALLTVVMGLLKTKKNILLTQCFQCAVYAFANFLLGGYSGSISNLITIVRNLYCFKNPFTFKVKMIFIVMQCIIGGYFNQLGIIGLLPIIAGVSFTWFLDSKSEITLKCVIIADNILWVYYNIVICSYVSLVVNALAIVSNIVGIFRIKSDRKKEA